ncbi:ribonuclease J [Pelosinus fermentans]|uniref:Ribonuclease J n=1 Tax=Pelosinus fermentans JBW45 TaxID=1192197 RepID=A0A0C5QED5_9FIRM|nr:ribonuclease J [Pelosinus fermentans]AJQ29156.1 Ribocuclease J [Pelosinus fermentans JBW45]
MEKQNKLAIIPLGGLGEIGKNMTVIRYGDDIVVLDCGLAFPEDEMLGIDLVIPDITYLLENQDKIRAVVITHGHEDHIGSLSYFLKQIDVPVYGTRLAMGIAEVRLKENNVANYTLIPIKPGDELTFGSIQVGFIQGNHSIPDVVGIYFRTPVGTIVHTGDFKIDYTPVDGKVIDLPKFAQLGNEGVLVLMSDSTNAERPGFTKSERTVGAVLDEAFNGAKGRILLATFASNVLRVQQAINSACKNGRKVAIIGRSMINVINIARELEYLLVPEGTIIDIDEIKNYPDNQILILTTGSQGEPMSALTRMALSDHRKVAITPSDTIIISATPIPGNEKSVSKTIDALLRLGAEVIHERSMGIHVSGHASQEELKLMLTLVRPQFLIPVHGEHRMLITHGKLAQDLGIPKENIFIGTNGQVFEFEQGVDGVTGKLTGKVTAGKVFVDGLGVGDVGNIVLRDRQMLSQDGVLIVVVTMDKGSGGIVAGPDLVSRGFVYVRESGSLMGEAKQQVKQALDKCEAGQITEWAAIKSSIRDALGKFIYEKTRRRPIILPIIMEV